MTDYTIAITATVPTIAHVKDGRLFCNNPDGYTLFLVHADGMRDVLEEGAGPVDKPFTYAVPEGARLELDANLP